MDMLAAMKKAQADLEEMKAKAAELQARIEALEAEEERERSFGRKPKAT
jgi:hypothetical protein